MINYISLERCSNLYVFAFFCAYTFRYLNEFKSEQEKANKDVQKYLKNPVNVFALIKRLSTDFERLTTIASDTTGR